MTPRRGFTEDLVGGYTTIATLDQVPDVECVTATGREAPGPGCRRHRLHDYDAGVCNPPRRRAVGAGAPVPPGRSRSKLDRGIHPGAEVVVSQDPSPRPR